MVQVYGYRGEGGSQVAMVHVRSHGSSNTTGRYPYSVVPGSGGRVRVPGGSRRKDACT